MTNLEKLKANLIAKVEAASAEEFEDIFALDDVEHFGSTCKEQHGEICPCPDGTYADCRKCIIEWLNSEARE